MYLRFKLFCLFCCSLLTLPSQADELLFSHSGHPVSKTVLIPLLQQIYGELGYQLSFQEAEGARAIKLLNDGVVDGDVGRLAPILHSLDTAMPAILLDSVSVVLYCRSELPCQHDVLDDARARILIPTQDATLQLLTREIKAKPYFNNDWDSIITMFNAGKIDYLLWIESRLLTPPTFAHANKTATRIGPFKLYHILHSRHQALFEPVSGQLKLHLAHLTDSAAPNTAQQ